MKTLSAWAWLVVCLLLPVTPLAAAEIVINEFVASNTGSLHDADGDSPDWIELYNPSDLAADLAGWHLTDNPADPTQWTFPAVLVPPHGLLIVFASGKNRSDPGQELHTSFQLGASGDYLALVKPDGVTVASHFGNNTTPFPPQFGNLAYGVAQRVESRTLISGSATATFLVPAANNGGSVLGSAWQGGHEPFNDAPASGWIRVTNGIGFDTSGTPAKVLHVDFGSPETLYSGPGANGTGGLWNAGGLGGTNLLYADGSSSAIGYATEQFDGGPFVTSWTTHPLLRDFLYDRSPSPIDGRLRLTGLSGTRAYDLYIYAGAEGGIYEAGSKTASVTYQGILPGGDPDYAANAPLQVPNNTGLLPGLTSENGEILVHFHTNPDTATFAQLGDNVVDFAGFTLLESSFLSGARTDVGALMQGVNSSAFLRLAFPVAAGESYDVLTFRIRYADGFIAWLNGVEVARRNAPGDAGGLPPFNAAALTNRSVSAALADETLDLSRFRSLLHAGTNILALQALSSGPEDTTFLLAPELTGTRIVSDAVPGYFLQPTPGSLNTNPAYAGLVEPIVFSPTRGFLNAPTNVVLSCPTPGTTLLYTLDGSLPDPANPSAFPATGPIPVLTTTTLRAAGFRTNFVPSTTLTHTYLFLQDVLNQPRSPPGFPADWSPGIVADYGMDPEIVTNSAYAGEILQDLGSLPSISIVMDRTNLFGSAGIYSNPTEREETWQRPSSIEYLDPATGREFQINCGISIQGAFGRYPEISPKHSFHLYFNQDFGPGKLEFPVFADSSVASFDHLLLRAHHADSWIYPFTTGFYGDLPRRAQYTRDQWSRTTHRAMGHAASASAYAHLYINGLYWGLYNIAERLNADFAAAHLGGVSTNWDVITSGNVFEGGPRARDGNMNAWNEMMALSQANASSETTWQAIQQILDVPGFCDYLVLYFYGGETDWPQQNWIAGRERRPGAKFQFFAWDTETVFYNLNEDRTGVDNPNTPGGLYSLLRANPEFRLLFADRAHQHLHNDGLLTPEAVLRQYTNLTALIRGAVVPESARWGDYRRDVDPHSQPGHQVYTRDDHWLPELENLTRNWIPARSDILLAQLRKAGLYPALDPPEFNQHGGRMLPGFQLAITQTNLSGEIWFTLDASDPRLPGGNLSPNAQRYTAPFVPPGNCHIRARVRQGTTWSALTEATFTSPGYFAALAITEIMYHPQPTNSFGSPGVGSSTAGPEFLELKNTGSTALDLSGLSFTRGVRFTFTNGTSLAPGRIVVLTADPRIFDQHHPGVPVFGSYEGQLDDGGETLELSHVSGGSLLRFRYDNQAPWPLAANGLGFSLVPTSRDRPAAPGSAASWRASTQRNGSPGQDDPPATVPRVLVNELLSLGADPQPDAVELFNPNPDPVDLGGWFLTDDPGDPKKFRFREGTTLPAGGFLVLDERDFNPSLPGAGAVPFAFGARGDAVYLFSGDSSGQLTGYSHGFKFGAAARGVSFGRHVISTGEEQFPAQLALTLNASNAGPRIGPVVLSEILYAPAGGDLPFIELRNITPDPVPLYDPAAPTHRWRLAGLTGLDGSDFDLPSNALIPGNGFLVVTVGNPDAFRIQYNVPASIPIVGSINHRLPAEGQTLELQRPGPANPGANAPYLAVDTVGYAPRSPWPIAAAAGGASLQRIVATAYGNDPASWIAGLPTPGTGPAVGEPPAVITQPLPLAAVAGRSAEFSVAVRGTEPVRYQWQKDGSNIPGATNATLTLLEVQPEQEGIYQAAIFDAIGSTASDPVQLTVLIPARITLQPQDQNARPGSTVLFTVAARGSTPISFQWRLNGVDIPLATHSSYVVTNAQLVHQGLYSVVITDATGPILSNPARLTLLYNPVFLQQPQSQTIAEGGTVTFRVVMDGTEPFSYRWRFNGATIVPFEAGKSTLTLSNVPLAKAGRYSVVVSNLALLTGVLSATATLNVLADTDHDRAPDLWETAHNFDPGDAADGGIDTDGDGLRNWEEFVAGTEPRDPLSLVKIDRVQTADGTTRIEFLARSNQTYTLQWKESPTSGQWARLLDVGASATNRLQQLLDPHPPSLSRLYRLVTPIQPGDITPGPVILRSPQPVTALAGAEVTFDLFAVGRGPLTYQWQLGARPLPGATNDHWRIERTQTNHSGEYTVSVSDSAGTTSTLPARLTVLVPPLLIAQPLDQAVPRGATVTFVVQATGNEPLSFFWTHNGQRLRHAAQASLTLTNVQDADAGDYSVYVRHLTPDGPVTILSRTATLRIGN